MKQQKYPEFENEPLFKIEEATENNDEIKIIIYQENDPEPPIKIGFATFNEKLIDEFVYFEINNFIEESEFLSNNQINKMQNKIEFLNKFNSIITLSYLDLKKEYRNKKYGSILLDKVIEYVQEKYKDELFFLLASPHDGSTMEQLKKLYTKIGLKKWVDFGNNSATYLCEVNNLKQKYKKEELNEVDNKENNKRTIFHGSNSDSIEKIESEYMFLKSSNCQHGVGMYFGSLEVAEGYGGNIYSVDVDSKDFCYDKKDTIDVFGKNINNIVSFLKGLHKESLKNEETKENTINYLQDFGIEIYTEKQINNSHFLKLAQCLKDEEIRNVQIELTERYGVNNFVSTWNNFFKGKIKGLYNNESDFFSIIDTNIEIKKIEQVNKLVEEKSNEKAKKVKNSIVI